MNNPSLSEPQTYRVQQGRFIAEDIVRKEAEEQFLATFNSPEECSSFVAMHNRLIDKIDLLEYELKKALDELKIHGV